MGPPPRPVKMNKTAEKFWGKMEAGISKGLVTFTQLVKVRRGLLVSALPSIRFHETFTRSSLALYMSRKL